MQKTRQETINVLFASYKSIDLISIIIKLLQKYCTFVYIANNQNFLGMEYFGIVHCIQKLVYGILHDTCILTTTQYFNFE